MPNSQEKEKVRDLKAEVASNGDLLLLSIAQKLGEVGYHVMNTLAAYFHPEDQMYELINKSSISPMDMIPREAIKNNKLTLRF